MDTLKYTPIILRLEDFYQEVTNTEEQDPFIPTAEERTQNYILAPRYYILVFPPVNNTQGSTSKAVLKVDLQREGLLKNTLRIHLKPSIGYGSNSCYRLEFWRWYPVVSKSSSSKPRRITQEFIRAEYILIPPVNSRTFLVNWNYMSAWDRFPLYFREILNTSKEVSVIRRYKDASSNIIIDEFKSEDVLDIFSFYGKDVKAFESVVVANQEKIFDKKTISLGLEYLANYPRADMLPTIGNAGYYSEGGIITPINYKVNYIRPLEGRELFYKDFVEESLAVNSGINNLYRYRY